MIIKTDQLKLWESDFGAAYTDRNEVKPEARLEGFKKILNDIDFKSVLEVGCNKGHNLKAISLFKNAYFVGLEPNNYARKKAKIYNNIKVVKGTVFNIPLENQKFDLVFSCGVLIHVKLEDLKIALSEMYRASKNYLLLIEYFSEEETCINYRGFDSVLWKRNFFEITKKFFPDIKLVKEGRFDEKDGFDDCKYWLFKK